MVGVTPNFTPVLGDIDHRPASVAVADDCQPFLIFTGHAKLSDQAAILGHLPNQVARLVKCE